MLLDPQMLKIAKKEANESFVRRESTVNKSQASMTFGHFKNSKRQEEGEYQKRILGKISSQFKQIDEQEESDTTSMPTNPVALNSLINRQN